MRKITDKSDESYPKCVCPCRIHIKKMDQQPQKPYVAKRNTPINNITAEIFLQPVAFCPEDKKLIAEKCIRDRQNIYKNGENNIVYIFSPKMVGEGIQPHAEDRVPSTR